MNDKIQYYLESIPIPAVVAGILAIAAFFIFVPGKLRLSLSIALMMVWLVLGQMIELGLIHNIAKTTGFAVYGLVAIAAFMDPGPRRQLPAMAFMYVLTAMLGFLYILTVSDFALAFVIRVQWLLAVIAALLVVRTIVDEASFRRVLFGLVLGLVIALVLPLSELVRNPGSAFKATGRFNPYGANPNHIGVLFALAAPLTLYTAVQTRRIIIKGLLLVSCAVAIGMGLLTASRSTMLVMLVCMLPVAIVLTRRPIFTVISLGIFAMILFWFFGNAPDVNLERMSTLETSRVQQIGIYLNVIADRPMFGLLETHGESFLKAVTLRERHAHNAYLESLFFGGISYSLPVFVLVIYTLSCSFTVWKKRHLVNMDSLLLNVLFAMMVMIYAHGFVNHSLYYPTTTLAFPHVLLSVFFISTAADLRLGTNLALEAEERALEYDFDDEYGELSENVTGD